jgi:hypothetical protein
MKGREFWYIKCLRTTCSIIILIIIIIIVSSDDRLCGLVVRAPGYRSRGPVPNFRRYQNFWEVAGLDRGPFRLMCTTEELFGRKSCGFGLEVWEYGRRDPSRWPRGTLCLQNLALTSSTSGGRSVDIVRTQATELLWYFRIVTTMNNIMPIRLKYGIKTPEHYRGCFKKSFTNLKAYINLFRRHVECFQLSLCCKTHQVLHLMLRFNVTSIGN